MAVIAIASNLSGIKLAPAHRAVTYLVSLRPSRMVLSTIRGAAQAAGHVAVVLFLVTCSRFGSHSSRIA